MNKCIALLSLISFISCTWSQDSYRFRNFTTGDGLSNNTVLDMTQDKYGRMWFATYDGITIYDGAAFKVIRSIPDKNNIPPGKAEHILTDSAGNIWVLFENVQLVRIITDNGACKRYPRFKALNGEKLDMDLNETGRFLASYAGHIYDYNAKTDSFEPSGSNTGFIPSEVQSVRAAEQQLEKQWHDINLSHAHYTPNHSSLWAASANYGLFKIAGPPKNGIYNYSTQNTKVFETNEFYSVWEDHLGNLWIGSKDHGIYMGTPQSNNFYYENAYADIGPIRALNKDSNNNLWVGTYSNGIYIETSAGKRHIDLARNIAGSKWNWIRSIHHGADGNMWVGTYEGLCKINTQTFSKEYYRPGPGSISKGRIYSIVEDNNKMYIGEWGALTIYNTKTQQFKSIAPFQHNVRKLFLSSRGKLWVGTEMSGIFVIDTSNYNIVKRFTAIDGNPLGINSNSIFEINEDLRGNIWIGAFGGLHCYDTSGTMRNVAWVNEAIPSALIYKILIDAKEQLWCSTAKGLVKINTDNSQVRVYDRTDGLNIYEFSEGAAFASAGNDLFFGGVNGVCKFYPEHVKESHNLPTIKISNLIINGERMETPLTLGSDSNFSFHYYQDNVQFDLTSILINAPEKCALAWKLVPADPSFSYAFNSKQSVQYNNLKPGRYKLVVKAANADGAWSKPNNIFEFKVEKPFWMEYYFILLLFLFAISATYFVIRIRFLKIKKKNRALEETIKKRTAKIERQKLELEKANQVLEERNAKVSAQRDQILAQRDHLLEMHQKLEESDRLKSKFFTNVSHDIRTPLTLIHAPLKELLRDTLTPEEHIPKLKRMLSNSEYMLKLLNQVLDKKKLEMGGSVLTITQGDLVHACRTVLDSFSDQIRQSHLKLIFTTSVETYHHRYDHDKLQQILFNLLTNAVKFTPQNGEIRCALHMGPASIRLEVSDNGIGIPSDRIKYIFDRYYQIGKGNENEINGSGIGLSMVKEFIDLLHGQIDVESRENKGSTFTVTLPLQLPQQKSVIASKKDINTPDIQTTTTPTTPPLENEKLQKNILVVEDNSELREYLSNLFEEHYHVADVPNGSAALDYLKKHPHTDLVISDWIMPEMDGIELCRTIKKKTRFQSMPFIMLTALTDTDNQIEGYWAGIDEYVSKPFDPEILLLKVSRILNREKQLKKAVKVEESIHPQNVPIKTHNDKLLERIMGLLEQEISNANFGQSELADKLGMNPTKLYRKVKELTQMTPNDFIRSVRIKRAEQLLKNKNLIINEISYMVGFNDPKYFSRCFSKTFGKSPSKYRHDFMGI